MKSVRLIECMRTWQAEGEDAGKKFLLVRFKHCNRAHGYLEKNGLTACIFCDSIVKMNVQAESEYHIKDLQVMLDENNLGLMVTGGDPGFGLNLQSTLYLINLTKTYIYNVETNGCNLLKLLEEINKNKNVKISLSPKIFNEDDYFFYTDLISKIINDDKVNIKLVYEGTEFNNRFLDFLTEIKFNNNRIWLMPEGKTRDELINNSPKVFDAAEKYKTNFSSRDHIIYGFV
jgi:organic radical activating enzyme